MYVIFRDDASELKPEELPAADGDEKMSDQVSETVSADDSTQVWSYLDFYFFLIFCFITVFFFLPTVGMHFFLCMLSLHDPVCFNSLWRHSDGLFKTKYRYARVFFNRRNVSCLSSSSNDWR